MMTIRFLLSILLAASWLPANAAGFDYDVFIMACKRHSCTQVVERMIENIDYSQNGLQLHIDTLSSRSNEVDARVSMKFQPGDDLSSSPQLGVTKLVPEYKVSIVSRTLKRDVFTSISAFASGDAVYQVWARLTAPK
ncbi:MAG: hypothetical protein M0Q22_14715 [Sulfuritalea sp.]|jgi:hypothetical protein|nr:hypothetical protein [Sulfuritalea sp.]